jgi:hypothetical protein
MNKNTYKKLLIVSTIGILVATFATAYTINDYAAKAPTEANMVSAIYHTSVCKVATYRNPESISNYLNEYPTLLSGATINTGKFTLKYEADTGYVIEDVGCDANVLTSYGRQGIIDLLFGQGTTQLANFTYISIANCSSAGSPANDTSGVCNQEYNATVGLTCALGRNSSRVGNYSGWNGLGAENLTFTFTDWNCANIVVNGTGLWNGTGSVGGAPVAVELASNTFTTVTMQSMDQLNVTWGVWLTVGQ